MRREALAKLQIETFLSFKALWLFVTAEFLKLVVSILRIRGDPCHKHHDENLATSYQICFHAQESDCQHLSNYVVNAVACGPVRKSCVLLEGK